jgi:hypothetical protein
MKQIVPVNGDFMVDKYIPTWRSTSEARNQLRLLYRPKHLRVLFIGEAPPASGRFFYRGDSGLYRAFRNAFQLVDPSITDANFLRVFQTAGCYLIDLCGVPVDQMSPAARRIACIEGEPVLGETLKTLQPPAIVTVVHSIRHNVSRAAARVGWNGQSLELPYPGRWKRHRDVFIEKLVPILNDLMNPHDRRAD